MMKRVASKKNRNKVKEKKTSDHTKIRRKSRTYHNFKDLDSQENV